MAIKTSNTMEATRQAQDRSLNGVDVGRLQDTVHAIKAAPGLAKFTYRVSNRWLEGDRNRSEVGAFRGAGGEHHRAEFVIDSSGPSPMAGGGEALNPVEYLLHALVGCLTTTFVYHASMEGVRIQAIESQIEGHVDLRSFLGLREEVPGGFEAVSVRFKVLAECPPDQLAGLMDAARRRSPVANFFVRAVPTSVACEVLQSGGSNP